MMSGLLRGNTALLFGSKRKFILLSVVLTAALMPWSSPVSGAEVTLRWDASDGASGYVLHYGNQSGTYDALVDVGSQVQHTVVDLAEGKSYYFAVTAYCDNDESGFSDEVMYTIVANLPPTADAGPDRTAEEMSAVILDGSKSLDPDDGIKALSWKQVAGPAVHILDSQDEILEFSAPQIDSNEELLVFELVVQDYGGLVSTDSCTVVVKAKPDAPQPDDSGGIEPHTDTVEIFKAVYRTRKDRLSLSARTDADNTGAVLTAWAETDDGRIKLGNLCYDSRKGYYASEFRNLDQAPDRIIVSSSCGGEASSSCTIR